jgi:26S proteasome regulatory subunit T1
LLDYVQTQQVIIYILLGADLRSVATEAGMFAIRARRKAISERDLLDSIEKVIKGNSKFSAT